MAQASWVWGGELSPPHPPLLPGAPGGSLPSSSTQECSHALLGGPVGGLQRVGPLSVISGLDGLFDTYLLGVRHLAVFLGLPGRMWGGLPWSQGLVASMLPSCGIERL